MKDYLGVVLDVAYVMGSRIFVARIESFLDGSIRGSNALKTTLLTVARVQRLLVGLSGYAIQTRPPCMLERKSVEDGHFREPAPGIYTRP